MQPGEHVSPAARERFLVTGALGCIGAWTVRTLVREQSPVVAFDLAGDRKRLRLIMSDDEIERITFVQGDITDLGSVERALDEHEITNLIHLAALQVPFARANPPLGAEVNVVGTVNIFEAACRRRDRIEDSISQSDRSPPTPDRSRGSSGRSARSLARARNPPARS